MITKEETIEGRYLRTCTYSLGVPAGSLAKLANVGTTWQGEFVFTVRRLNVNTRSEARPISDRN
jgi:hypothetical protein